MYALIISHEVRSLTRTSLLGVLLLVLAGALAFAAWSGVNALNRQMRGADAAIVFEEAMRGKMLGEVIEYEKRIEAEGGIYEFAAVNHAPGKGPPQGTNAGAVGGETASYAVLPRSLTPVISISDVAQAH